MTDSVKWPSYSDNHADDTESSDAHMIERDGVEYAGCHLILDIWQAENLDNIEEIEDCFRRCVIAAEATLLHIHLHHFTEGGGVSGVAVLAESHISIHTWPEKNYAALDIFMCGNAKPEKTIPIILETFQCKRHKVTEILRGEMD